MKCPISLLLCHVSYKHGTCACWLTFPHLTVVEPEPHVLLFDAKPLWQVQVDVLDGGHATEAAGVCQNPLQGSIWRWDVSCKIKLKWKIKHLDTNPSRREILMMITLWDQTTTRPSIQPTSTHRCNQQQPSADWGLVVRKQQEKDLLVNQCRHDWSNNQWINLVTSGLIANQIKQNLIN